jgi:hypothetical protein
VFPPFTVVSAEGCAKQPLLLFSRARSYLFNLLWDFYNTLFNAFLPLPYIASLLKFRYSHRSSMLSSTDSSWLQRIRYSPVLRMSFFNTDSQQKWSTHCHSGGLIYLSHTEPKIVEIVLLIACSYYHTSVSENFDLIPNSTDHRACGDVLPVGV